MNDPCECGGYERVLDTATADLICTGCGLCVQQLECGWEFPSFASLSHVTFHRKSVHDKNSYFSKKLDVLCPRLSSGMRRQMARMFRKAEFGFQHIVTKRKYSPSYNYVSAQLLRLLDSDDLAASVPRIKGTRKLRELDATWRLVCQESGWRFTPLLKWRP